jgi:hypothetical protein
MSREAASISEGAPPDSGARRRRWLWIVFGLYLLVLGDIASRVYFAVRSDSSFLASDLYLAFYDELREVDDAPITRDDDVFDVLLLGGSVLHPAFGTIAPYLGERLEENLGRPVRVFNLAHAAHSSRDSLIKYRMLEDKRFDRVVFYHGINEARLNSAPPDLYRDDYTHMSWYARIAAIGKHPEVPVLLLPYALHFMWIKFGENTGLIRYLPKHAPRDEWTQYGGDVRTDRALAANLGKIIQLARERADPLVVITFVTYLPEGYDLEKPHDEQAPGVNDYSRNGSSRIELWGRGPHVMKAIEAHNAAIRRGAAGAPDVTLVDLARTYPARGEYMVDVCHFTDAGCQQFVDAVAPAIAAPVVDLSLETVPRDGR